MSKTLEDLFFGEIAPNMLDYAGNSTLSECAETIEKNEKLLLEVLSDNEKKLFISLLDAQSEFDGASAYENFIRGFHLGANLTLETFILPQK